VFCAGGSYFNRGGNSKGKGIKSRTVGDLEGKRGTKKKLFTLERGVPEKKLHKKNV